MSGKNNVNPNHYKVAGRERQGEDIVHEREKQQAGLDAAARWRGPANFIPGAAPAGEAPPPPESSRPEGKEARPMASSRQRAAARRNIKKAATVAQRRQTLKKLPKKTRIALGKQAAKARRRTAAR